MSGQIIGMHEWLATPIGQYLLAWERAQMAAAVADVFGFHALQLGLPELDALEANRMPHRWLATQSPAELDLGRRVTLVTEFSALPFPANSLDLVVLPHALELTADPHGTLREVARVLVPEGRVVICGLNPLSLWGLRRRRVQLYRRLGLERLFLPQAGEWIGYRRLRDWLSLLNLAIEDEHFGCYCPAFSSHALLQRFAWMEAAGARWWPILGASYCLVAVKRVHGMTLLNPAWKPARRLSGAPVSVANSAGSKRAGSQKHG
ncbi:methyltransferase domain-containing protein [Rhodoferax sp.]|uniref:class I SAM-dependent methyltransferase n=1 Tax=Rhodoferax sp. TaxID=50421 RepID=UPI002626C7D3|nr:methyltransferase domain-containing protein [Rhodoferax sp.]MDD2924788.1 methyltransferase domain-containing protein [Rhodoferax sp.]